MEVSPVSMFLWNIFLDQLRNRFFYGLQLPVLVDDDASNQGNRFVYRYARFV